MLVGKRCANLNSLEALERVLKNLGRRKTSIFLSPHRDEQRAKSLRRPPEVYQRLFYYSNSVVGAHWQRLPSLVSIATISVEKLTKTICTRRCARRRILRSLWDCLNTLFKESGQIAAHYRNQCKLIVLLPKKRA